MKNNLNGKNKINYEEPKCKKLLSVLTKNSYCQAYNNSFSVFKSIDNILYLIYTNKKNAIIYFNLEKQQKVCEIKNNNSITGFKHYLDKINKRDLLITISSPKNDIKLWSIKNMECILHLQKIYKEGYLYSACFINHNNNIYIISSNCNFEGNSEGLYVFDLKSNKINEIKSTNEPTYFIDIFYDKKNCKNYIITTHYKYIKSYDYGNNELYYRYDDGERNFGHFNADIYKYDEELIKIIESCWNGIIRIWDFHSGQLLNKIELLYDQVKEICLWNKDYLILDCDDIGVKLLDLNNGKITNILFDHNNWTLNNKKVLHPKYGECLLSQGFGKDKIKMWIIKKQNH